MKGGEMSFGLNRSFLRDASTISLADRIARALDGVPAKIAARAAGVSVRAAEAWKAGRGVPSGEALCRLCAEFDAVWDATRTHSGRRAASAEAFLDDLAARLH